MRYIIRAHLRDGRQLMLFDTNNYDVACERYHQACMTVDDPVILVELADELGYTHQQCEIM